MAKGKPWLNIICKPLLHFERLMHMTEHSFLSVCVLLRWWIWRPGRRCSDTGFKSLETTSVAWKGTEEALKSLPDYLLYPELPDQTWRESGSGNFLHSMRSNYIKRKHRIKLAHERQGMIIHSAWKLGEEAEGNLSYVMQHNLLPLSFLVTFCSLLTVPLYCLMHIIKCVEFRKWLRWFCGRNS